MFERYILPLLQKASILGHLLEWVLRAHNLSYKLAGILSRHLEPGGLHPKHRLIEYHQWFTERIQTGWRVLDIGCGNGALAYDIKSHCSYVLAIDISEDIISLAKRIYSRKGIQFVCADATRYKFRGTFDAIVLSNVLEHIMNRTQFLTQLYLLKDNCTRPILLIRVPMFERDWLVPYKKELGIEWRLDSTHETEYTQQQLHEELTDAGFNIVEIVARWGELYAVAAPTGKPSMGKNFA